MKRIFLKSRMRMLFFNQIYVYVLHWLYLILDLMPGFIRRIAFKILLGKFGRNNFIDYHVFFKFPWLIELGDKVSINRASEFFPSYVGKGKIVIGSDVVIGPRVSFYASGPDPYHESNYESASITVESHVWIGGNCTILSGVSIGEWSIVGAGSVVSRDVPPFAIVAGVPAKVIGWRKIDTKVQAGADLAVGVTMGKYNDLSKNSI